MLQQLDFRLNRLLGRLKIKARQGKEIKQLLFNHYQESHRAYHNLSHIWNLIQIHRNFRTQLAQPDLVELVIWFHDVIYDPVSKSNEWDSARLMEKLLSGSIHEKR